MTTADLGVRTEILLVGILTISIYLNEVADCYIYDVYLNTPLSSGGGGNGCKMAGLWV